MGRSYNANNGRAFTRIKIDCWGNSYPAKVTSVEGEEDGYLVLGHDPVEQYSIEEWTSFEPESHFNREIKTSDPQMMTEEEIADLLDKHKKSVRNALNR